MLARHLAKFLARYPELFVELIMRDSVGDLVADGFDLAVRFGEPPIGTFVARKLMESRVITVASPAYIKAHGKPKHPAEVESRDCIDFYDAANARAYEWEVRRKNEVLPLRVKGRLLVSDSGTLLSACEAGAGIAQVLEIGCEQLIRSGRLIDLFPEWSDERFPLHAIFPNPPTSCSESAGIRGFHSRDYRDPCARRLRRLPQSGLTFDSAGVLGSRPIASLYACQMDNGCPA